MTMDTNTLWLVIIAGGIGTWLIRVSFLAIFGSKEPPDYLKRALRFVPASVLSALVAPAVVLSGPSGFDPTSTRLWAGLLAGVVAWRTKNVLATIAAGLAGLWALQWLLN